LVPDTGMLAPAVPAPEQAARPDADDPEAAEIDEPEIASAAPSVPTRASVAKQATYRNSINLSKINLIGVYGSSSNRYAMVRQANGRFVRVEVGDRVDGGRVAAISERELHYVKNGTTHKLAMPKG
ncbi:MAG: translation initiation factor 2, partial [Rhodobacterales bacterium]